MAGFDIVVIGLVALIILVAVMAVTIVPQGREFTLEEFGRYRKTLKPGLALIIPFYQKISNRVDMRERVVDIPSQDVITKDNVMVTAPPLTSYTIYRIYNI